MSTIPSLLALFLAFAISASSLALNSRADDSVTANCLHDFAYTFDNGPYLWEDEIVDDFDCATAKTTFFVKGNYQSCIYSEESVQSLRYAFEAGHQVASSGWSNDDFSTLSNAQIDVEIQRLDEAVIKILGVKPKVFRANSLSGDAATYITTKWGKTVVSFDQDSGDTNAGATSQGIYQFYQGLASEGQGHPHLVRSDETQSIAVDALDLGTIELFTTAGIRLVTVAQCLDIAPYDVVGNYGIRDDSWTCDGSWSPSTTSTCAQTYTTTASDTTCVAIAAKFGVTAQAVYFANPFLNCQDVWNFTPVCIPAAPTPAPQITCAQNYNTVAGETCTTIADNFGVTPENLFDANPFLSCNDIWTGTPLCIPPSTTAVACSTTYHSVSGDTCTSIATLYGLSSDAIKNSNSFLDCNDIWVNTPICIPPGGSGPPTSTTSSSTSSPSCVSTYYSVDGDDCATIEAYFGLSSGAIQQANSFLDCNDIWVNTPICIPPGGSTPTSGGQCTRTIIVPTLGETCDSIGEANGVSGAQIKTWNDFLDCNDIWVGTPVCVAH